MGETGSNLWIFKIWGRVLLTDGATDYIMKKIACTKNRLQNGYSGVAAL